MITDTHSHLYGEEFNDDIDEVLLRAREAGVDKIFLPNINLDTIEPMLALSRKHPGFLYPMIGLHPEDINDDWRSVLTQMEQWLNTPNHPFIAIGEVGLDYYWDRSRYEEQQEVLAIQIDWAVRSGLPLMIHTRNAHQEMVSIIKEKIDNLKSNQIENCKSSHCKLQGVFHCFGGTADEAEELLSFDDFMLGIGGIVTFKKSPLPEVLKAVVPLERIVIETDSPYLAPVPFRGKRNESSFALEVLRKLSEIYGRSMDEIASITTTNTIKTFPKSQL